MKITLTRGATINLGNYESARIDISFEFKTEDYDLEERDGYLKEQLQKRVAEIQTAAGLPPHPTDRYTG